MLTTLEGTYQNGKIILAETPDDIAEGKVLVTFLANGHRNGNGKIAENKPPPSYMTFGMWKTDHDITEEDFKIAEFHGDPDDGLDWP